MASKADQRNASFAKQVDIDPFAYGLQHVAQHNAELNAFADNGLFDQFDDGFGQDFGGAFTGYTEDQSKQFFHQEPSFDYPDPGLLTPPSPVQSQPAGEGGVRTRSGRRTRRTDSPLSSTKDTNSRISKSPRPKRTRAKKGGANKASQLQGPLSELTKDSKVPVRDIEAWVNRSCDERVQESQKRKGHIARPMNSFMLYRSAYAERAKDWCQQNNHQVVSSVAGESWPQESDELREQYNEWARVERDNHAKAFPNYRFSPSKANLRKRRDEEDEEDQLDVRDPDGEYRPSKALSRSLQMEPQTQGQFDSPYILESTARPYERNVYGQSWIGNHGPRPMPAPYAAAHPYGGHHSHPDLHGNTFMASQMDNMRTRLVSSPASVYTESSPIGFPGAQHLGHPQWQNSALMPYQQVQPESVLRSQRPNLYHDHGVTNYRYPAPPGVVDSFDDAYPSYQDAADSGRSEASWPNFALDPSLIGQNEVDGLYGHPQESADFFKGY